MKLIRKALPFILILALLLSLSLPALAASERCYRNYKTYMCVGDSIAAGTCLRRDGTECYFDQENLTLWGVDDDEDIYRGFNFERSHTSYHAIIQETLADTYGRKVELIQAARSGLRGVELRYMLDGTYNEYDENELWGNTFWDEDGNGFTLRDIDKINAKVDYKNSVKRADLMTLNIGSNDVFSYSFAETVGKLTAGSAVPLLAELGKYLETTGDLGSAVGAFISLTDTLGLGAIVTATLVNSLNKSLQQFKENYTAVLDWIFKNNSHIDVVGVGLYNPLTDVRISEDSAVQLDPIVQPILDDINGFIAGFEEKYPGRFFYADTVGTQTYGMNVNDNFFSDYFIYKVHPTLAGHRFMAERILDCLPDGEVPIVRVSNTPADGKIRISWIPVPGASGYRVYVSKSQSSGYTLLGTTSNTEFRHVSAKVGSTYYYRVSAVIKSVERVPSDPVKRCCDLPRPVVKISNNASTGKLHLEWNKISGAVSYEVWRAESKNGTYKKMLTTKNTTYTNTSAVAGKTYYYKVKAVSSVSSASSAYSTPVYRTCDCAAPVVKIALSGGDPRLTWAKVNGADQYVVYRATSKNGTYKKMITVTGTSYKNTSAVAGNTYYYKVVAISSRSSYSASAYSNLVSIRAK